MNVHTLVGCGELSRGRSAIHAHTVVYQNSLAISIMTASKTCINRQTDKLEQPLALRHVKKLYLRPVLIRPAIENIRRGEQIELDQPYTFFTLARCRGPCYECLARTSHATRSFNAGKHLGWYYNHKMYHVEFICWFLPCRRITINMVNSATRPSKSAASMYAI